MIAADLHPALKPVAFLLGTWSGEGAGDYPTIEAFTYREEARFTHTGKPFLVYTQRTQRPQDGQPMHSEAGYLRCSDDGRVEFVIAQPIGFAEIELGRVTGNRIELESMQVLRAPTAKAVTAIARSFWLEGDHLRYEVRMAMSGGPLVHHLTATLGRLD